MCGQTTKPVTGFGWIGNNASAFEICAQSPQCAGRLDSLTAECVHDLMGQINVQAAFDAAKINRILNDSECGCVLMRRDSNNFQYEILAQFFVNFVADIDAAVGHNSVGHVIGSDAFQPSF